MMLKRNDAGPMFTGIVLIIVGVLFAIWLSTMSHDILNRVVDTGLVAFTMLLGQPGVFLAFMIMTKDKWSWKKRVAIGGVTFILLAAAIPMVVSALLSPYIFQ